ncbi:uncharacterized protein LOC141702144 isoform X1 [Apium graveolens]|uniref:uncharacterized protein LOC141702144 isoform X1 n=1 Tax=Apium graveolens TaxID=4045 RepID=UPI003D7B4C14
MVWNLKIAADAILLFHIFCGLSRPSDFAGNLKVHKEHEGQERVAELVKAQLPRVKKRTYWSLIVYVCRWKFRLRHLLMSISSKIIWLVIDEKRTHTFARLHFIPRKGVKLPPPLVFTTFYIKMYIHASYPPHDRR